MSARLIGIGHYLRRATGLSSFAAGYSCCFWAKFHAVNAVAPNYDTLLSFIDDPVAYTNYLWMGRHQTDPDSIVLEINGVSSAQFFFTIGKWNHYALMYTGTSLNQLIVNGVVVGQVSANTKLLPFTVQHLGSDTYAEDTNLELAYFREWHDNLLVNDLIVEMHATNPERDLADLDTHTPLGSDLLDASGHGHHWTAVGAPTFTPQPPFLANSSPTTAIEIASLPFTASLNLNPGGGMPAMDAWYRYVPVAGDRVIGAWAFGDLVGNRPKVEVFTPDGYTNHLGIDGLNVPVQFPVVVAQSYYLRIRPVARSSSPDVTLSVLRAPHEAVPVGSIAVNDDAHGHPLALMSSVDGDDFHVLQYVTPFPNGESGDVLNNGVVLVHDLETTELVGFHADYTEKFRLPGNVMSLLGCIRTCRGTQRFWALLYVAPNAQARYVTDDGTFGPVHVLGIGDTIRPGCLAVNNDESVLYYVPDVGPDDGKIIAFNLLTDTTIGVFAPAMLSPFHTVADLLVLSDGSILAVYYTETVASTVFVKRYGADGTLLNTYAFGSDHQFPSGTPPRLAYGLNDPNSFWIWRHPLSTPFISVFSEISVVTGLPVRVVRSQEYEFGEYVADETATPRRFGNSFSCPFWVAMAGLPPHGEPDPGPEPEPEGPEPPPGPIPAQDIETRYIRRLRQAPHLADEHKIIRYHMFWLDVETGVGRPEGQGRDPKVYLSWSDDGGRRWSNEYPIYVGSGGRYKERATWHRLGSSRDRIFRVTMSDPVDWVLIDAFLEIARGTT